MPDKDVFSVLSLNIQSTNAKFCSFTAFLTYLNDHNIHFSAITLQETWLSCESDISLYNIPGYHLIHKGKSCSAHGGLMTYLNDEFTFTIRSLVENSEKF